MFELYFKAWNFFKKKSYLLYMLILSIIYFGFGLLTQNYITAKIIEFQESIIGMSVTGALNYFFNFYGFELLLILLIWIFSLFIINYIIYVVSLSVTKRKETFKKTLRDVFVFTLLLILVFAVFTLLFSLLLKFINIFTVIILIILGLCFIVSLLIFTFAIIKLGLKKITISKAFNEAWDFIKRKFWLSLVFVIFLIIATYLIYYIVDFLYNVIFYYNETASLIIRIVLFVIIMLYTTNALSLFVNKYSK